MKIVDILTQKGSGKLTMFSVAERQNDKNQKNYNPEVADYPIFFATQRLEGKNSRGDKLYWTKDKKGTTTDPKLALCDKYGHPIVYHDLYATCDYNWDEKLIAEAKKMVEDAIEGKVA